MESNTENSTRPTTSTTVTTKEKRVLTKEEIEKFRQQANTVSPLFEKYYQEVLGLPKNEFSQLLKYFVKDLPISFRISKISPYCDNLEEELTSLFIKYNYLEKRVKRHEFNFLNNVYEIDTLNKNDKNDMEIKGILQRENDIGILRQEIVAMIPVNLVNIEEDDVVLDMCAAPGNKTVQVAEIMQEKARNKNILSRGLIIANEIEPKRAANMAHFFKTQFPTNVIITNVPGEALPLIKKEELKPNVVICDVPCSGDGTLRKNKGLRKRWKTEYGFINHPLQINLLDNAVRQCKEGGKIIYSTCSINPIENESVVCNILERYKDELELVNVVKELNAMKIKFSEGLIRWKVCTRCDEKGMEFAHEFSEVKSSQYGQIKKTMFHKVYTKDNYTDNIYFSDPLNLRRCIRIYSHQNDTGSFFIAVLQKKKKTQEKKTDYSIPLNPDKAKTIGEDLDDFMEFLGLEREMKTNQNETDKKVKDEFFATQVDVEIKEDKPHEEEKSLFQKYVNITEYKDSYQNLKEIFKFKTEEIVKFLYCPRETSHKIFLFSEKLIQMIDLISKMNINVIRCGMTAFKKERQNFKTKYRLSHYGGILLEQYLGAQVIELKTPNLIKMLLEDKDGNIQLANVPKDEKDFIDKCENGSVVVIYEGYVILCRKGKGTLALMIPKLIFESVKKYILETIAGNEID